MTKYECITWVVFWITIIIIYGIPRIIRVIKGSDVASEIITTEGSSDDN